MKEFVWAEEVNGQPSIPMRRKRKVAQRKIEYIGWGSKPLIEFLESVGKDTGKELSRYEVATIITQYVNGNGLHSPRKKKKIQCDERLHALFGKQSISRTKINELLEEHFAENHDESDDDLRCSSEADNYEENIASRSRGGSASKMKKVPETPKSCFAAVIPENIKLVYLKRTLVQDLLRVPENFETKVVGSFVRVKSDRNDIFQKHPFQIQQVTGIKNVSGAADASIGICLRVSNCINDIPISVLSDDNFSEEECEDLRDRIKSGLVKRPTIVELEQKAQMLHVDIMKHWIPKEISLLQRLIDHANEKGRRKELFEYLDKRKLLQTPSEQEKLLLKIPKVIAEELEPEGTPVGAPEKGEGTNCSPGSIFRSSEVPNKDAAGSRDLVFPSQSFFNDLEAGREGCGTFMEGIIAANDPAGSRDAYETSKQVEEIRTQDAYETSKKAEEISLEDQPSEKGGQQLDVIIIENSGLTQAVHLGEEDSHEKPETQVINISDDELPKEDSKDKDRVADGLANDSIWHYADPRGIVQGPFPLHLMKRWSDSNYFSPDFTVWRSDQSQHEAVPLAGVLSKIFPD